MSPVFDIIDLRDWNSPADVTCQSLAGSSRVPYQARSCSKQESTFQSASTTGVSGGPKRMHQRMMVCCKRWGIGPNSHAGLILSPTVRQFTPTRENYSTREFYFFTGVVVGTRSSNRLSWPSRVTPLFECHAGCSCTAACRLRPTQQGGGRVLPRIKLRFTGQKGWGAYAADFVSRGSFVLDYTGEYLSLGEARRRVLEYDRIGANYVLAAREFFQEVREERLAFRVVRP